MLRGFLETILEELKKRRKEKATIEDHHLFNLYWLELRGFLETILEELKI